MHANPVLVEVTRGNWVENRHRGAVCISNTTGPIRTIGDVEASIFPRSAVKSIQALAMYRSGAVAKFGLSDEEVALACASHNAEPEHVAKVEAFLEKIGCTVDDLECGAQPPVDKTTRQALADAGKPVTALFNNCSGKHSGMLAVAKALGADTKDYVTRDHPVQKLVRACAEDVIGVELTTGKCGTDGCSIPTWAAPLKQFALGFARMIDGEGLDAETAKATHDVFDAATKHPFLVRGTDTLDTDVMQAFGGRLMLKIGADGVFCGALRDKGLGFALKIDDGNLKAAEVAIANILLAIAEPNAQETEALEKYKTHQLYNWRKINVGEMRGTAICRFEEK